MRTWRERAAAGLDRLASLVFAGLIVAMPSRLRADPFPHPTSLPAPLSDVVVYAIDGLIAVTIGLWLLARILDRRAIRLGPRPLAIAAVALVALAWLTLPFGVAPALSVFGAVRLTALVVLAAYVVNEVRDLRSLAVPIGLMVGIQAVVAIGQFLDQGSVGLGTVGELRLDPARSGVSVVLRDDGARILRAYGLSPHPNVLGGFFATGVLLLLGSRPAANLGRVLQVVAVALGVAGILVTFSRGAWVGLAVGLVAGLVILGVRTIRTDARRWLAVGAVMLLVAGIGGWQLREEVAVRAGLSPVEAPTERRSVDERLAQIGLGWRVFVERPLVGVGMSAVPVEMQRLDPGFAWSYYPPHLVPLVVAAELGIGGGVALLVLLLAPWLLLLRARARWNAELAAASAALAAVTVAGLFDDYPWVGGPGRTLLWVVLGLWAMAWIRAKPPSGSVDAN